MISLPFRGKAKGRDQTSPAARGRGVQPVARFFQVAFGPIGLAVLLGWYAGDMVRGSQRHESRMTRGLALAQLMASDLSSRLNQIRRVLVASGTDPEIAEMLGSYSTERARAWGRSVSRCLPGGLSVELFPTGWDHIEGFGSPWVGFASLDQMRQVEKTARPSSFEVHRASSGRGYISVAVPVRSSDDGKVLGSVHAALSMDWLTQAMEAVPAEAGAVLTWRQRLPHGGWMALTGDDPESGEDGAVEVTGSIWEVAYHVDDPQQSGVGRVVSWSLPLGVLVAAALVLIWQGRRLGRALQADQAAMIGFVEAVATGRPPSRLAVRLAESEGFVARLERIRPLIATGGSEVPVAASRGAGGEAQVAPEDLVTGDQGGAAEQKAAPGGRAPAPGPTIPASLLTGYDIRGVVGETLTAATVELLGRAIGSAAYERGQQAVIIGRDSRPSSVELAEALARGLRQSGRDVIDLGLVPTPLVYFATNFLGTDSGVMVTGSHNPPQYNGLKVVLGGEVVAGEGLRALARRVAQGDLLEGEGAYREQSLLSDYVGRIGADVRIARPMKVVVDCGNGAAAEVAPMLLRTLGCDVVPLFCESDGSLPNHHPDPSRPENLEDLVAAVQAEGADLGLAYDGDGDRLGVVDNAGKIIWPDRLLMLFAQDVLLRQPGADIIYDVKSTRDLTSHILLHGGRPLMWKSGHSRMRAKLKETGALLAGELSGHFFFEERWYGFDDALYASARLLEILAEEMRTSAEVFAELPESLATPEIQVPTPDGAQHALVSRIIDQANIPGATVITIDGLRAELADGWGLVRASNTMPCLVFRFEANDPESLAAVQARFREMVQAVDPHLSLPF